MRSNSSIARSESLSQSNPLPTRAVGSADSSSSVRSVASPITLSARGSHSLDSLKLKKNLQSLVGHHDQQSGGNLFTAQPFCLG